MSDDPNVHIEQSDIFFYDEINSKTALLLNRYITQATANSLQVQANYGHLPPVKIRMNSLGGYVSNTLAVVDAIKQSIVPVHTIVEGFCAREGTLISIVGQERFIGENSLMLIPQLSSGFWGTFEAQKDDYKYSGLMMEIMINIYLKNSKFTEEQLKKLLKKDLYLSAEQCLEYGLVDQVI